jgi:7,8-dihydroneopterin aldolase/epimerase/oxygenase
MDETAAAFELPHARAQATHVGPPLDRISVRDYVRTADIGAFRPEHGVAQRLRFNVVLEVCHSAASAGDDVDRVISYDSITEAIDAALDRERVDLLETLAERVARRCLRDPRAVRVFVRAEKLDRIAGALGVEIVRMQVPEATPRVGPAPEPATEAAERPLVVYLSPEALEADKAGWLEAVAALGVPAVVCIAPPIPLPAPQTARQRRVGLLEIEQAALALADRDARFEVVETATELDWALKQGRLSIWAPARMVEAAREADLPDASAPLRLAAWLARRLGGVLLAADAAASGDEARRVDPLRPGVRALEAALARL